MNLAVDALQWPNECRVRALHFQRDFHFVGCDVLDESYDAENIERFSVAIEDRQAEAIMLSKCSPTLREYPR